MTTEYGSPDFFPQTWALYRCPCGRLECEHGRHVDELPPGWERIDRDEGRMDLCPSCSAARKAGARETPG